MILYIEEILHQLIGSLSHYLQGFIHPRIPGGCLGILPSTVCLLDGLCFEPQLALTFSVNLAWSEARLRDKRDAYDLAPPKDGTLLGFLAICDHGCELGTMQSTWGIVCTPRKIFRGVCFNYFLIVLLIIWFTISMLIWICQWSNRKETLSRIDLSRKDLHLEFAPMTGVIGQFLKQRWSHGMWMGPNMIWYHLTRLTISKDMTRVLRFQNQLWMNKFQQLE